MKIGIMSMQRVVNYGSYLQSYGLKKMLENLGHDVSFVDYKLEKPINIDNNEIINNNFVKRIFRQFSLKYRVYRKKQIKMNLTFDEFVKKYNNYYLSDLGVSKEPNYNPKLDLLLIGSDEVFNCTQSNIDVGYSRELFGLNRKSNYLASYAASFGSTNMDKLNKYKIKDEIKKMLNDFDYISVRDTNSYNIVHELIDKPIYKNIDPVLLYGFPEVDNIKIELNDYMIVYAYAGRISKSEEEKIKEFSKKKNLKILSLGFYQPFCDIFKLANPIEVLAYFKNAKYVVTDTFHGTVFSIKYQIPFATIIRPSNKEKLSDLLNVFNLLDRRIIDMNDLFRILDTGLDLVDIKSKISIEQNKSTDYLKYILGKEC